MIKNAWVIQRDDGKFLNRDDFDFTNNLYEAWFYDEDKKWLAEEDIKNYKYLQNCKPTKVEIRVINDKE